MRWYSDAMKTSFRRPFALPMIGQSVHMRCDALLRAIAATTAAAVSTMSCMYMLSSRVLDVFHHMTNVRAVLRVKSFHGGFSFEI